MRNQLQRLRNLIVVFRAVVAAVVAAVVVVGIKA